MVGLTDCAHKNFTAVNKVALIMPGPYNTDLRCRAVFLHYIRRLDYKTIGNQLFMSERSVHRYVKLFHQTGDVIPQKSTGRPRELTGLEEQVILETVLHIPTLFLDELVSEVHQRCGTNPSKTTIFRVLRRYNFSRIKVSNDIPDNLTMMPDL